MPAEQEETVLQTASVASPARVGLPPAVSDHTLLRRIGEGAYGEVWLAQDILGAYRAVKVVRRARFDQDKPFEREFNGIQQYASISRSHPGWIDILHVGRNDTDGYFFYIMELGDDESAAASLDPEKYEPKTLAGELRRRGNLPLAECVPLSLALADALEHLHQHGLIHRDVKPSNVIFVQGTPKFADIGLVTHVSRQSGDVSFLGTAGYMAPEGPGAPTADIYSLGMLIFETSTGCHRELFPEFPSAWFESSGNSPERQLSRIIMKACEYQPENRYPTAAAFREDLARLLAALPPAAKT